MMRGSSANDGGGFDEFRYREVCLNAATRGKNVTTYLNKIKDHIIKEASLDSEVTENFHLHMCMFKRAPRPFNVLIFIWSTVPSLVCTHNCHIRITL